jgi:ppGpp synthetase/RelA/SpoT-type nucleotidyltranferase
LFLTKYAETFDSFEAAAVELQLVVSQMLADLLVPIHIVTARAKRPSSLRIKCRRKDYANPAVQATDLLAVRVITYSKNDIDDVARRLRSKLHVSEAKSRDARKELAENEFGYRSVHLIARLRAPGALDHAAIGKRWFEVQVRSILDHAWSEIEHEAVYKSGVRFPSDVRRRFKAVAASLEVLEDAFVALAAEHDKLISQYRGEYLAGASMDQPFDVARLEAFLEIKFPSGVGWRAAEKGGSPFPHGSASTAIEALEAANLVSARRLAAILETESFRHSMLEFAAIERIAPEAASHLAIVVLAIAVAQPRLLREQFPDILFSPSVAAAAKVAS